MKKPLSNIHNSAGPMQRERRREKHHETIKKPFSNIHNSPMNYGPMQQGSHSAN